MSIEDGIFFSEPEDEQNDYSIVNELRTAYLEGWLSKEDIDYALQFQRITTADYYFILGIEPKLGKN